MLPGEGPLVGAAEQEQRFGEVDRPGVDEVEAVDELAVVAALDRLRATSSSVCVIASGVRSSWEALAAKRCCSATWASSRASMASKASASSRNSSLPPFQPDPVGERPRRGRAGGVGDARQGGEHPAGEEPPAHEAEHQQERQHRTAAAPKAAGPKLCGSRARGKSESLGTSHAGGHVSQQEHPDGGEQQGAREHEEAGVAEGELEADAQAGLPIHGRSGRLGCGVDAVAGAGDGGDDPGFAEPLAQCRDRDAHGVGERVGVLDPTPASGALRR